MGKWASTIAVVAIVVISCIAGTFMGSAHSEEQTKRFAHLQTQFISESGLQFNVFKDTKTNKEYLVIYKGMASAPAVVEL